MLKEGTLINGSPDAHNRYWKSRASTFPDRNHINLVHFKNVCGKEKEVLAVIVIFHVFCFIFCDFETCNIISHKVYYFL